MKRLLVTLGAAALACGCNPIDGEENTAPPEGQALLAHREGDSACAPGALDTTFGGEGTGIARWSIRPDDAGGFTALDLDLTRDGTRDGIVAAGWGLGGLGGSTFKLARLRHDGTPDASFGGGEVVATQWGASTANYATARAVGHQHGGRLVAIGGFDNIKSQDIALARYQADGSLDTSFGADGKPLIDLGGAEIITSGLVAPDGTILAAGSQDGQLLVARFSPDGALDTSFGNRKGYFTALQGASSSAAAVTLDAAGRILVAGSSSGDGQHSDLLVMRLTPDGALDRSFGLCGVVLSGEPDRDERAVAVAVGADGLIVVAGDTGGDDADFLVRRLLASGAPDLCFGHHGQVSEPITADADRAEAVALLPDGGILVAGNGGAAGSTGPILARYTRQGGLDVLFGTGGILPLNLGEYGVAHTLLIDADQRALIGGGDEGATPGPGTYAVVARMCL